MQIVIIGVDRVYIWKIKGKKRNKLFYRINKQMYKVHTNELQRVYRFKYGKYIGTDDTIVYRENSRFPYDTNGSASYDQDNILEEIDAIKLAYRSRFGFGLWGRVSAGTGWFWPLVVLLAFGIPVAMAFLG